MLIFDGFSNEKNAAKFSEMVKSKFRLSTSLHSSQESSDKIDLFPFRLMPPIVLVERPDSDKIEDEIINSVNEFKGEFAGT